MAYTISPPIGPRKYDRHPRNLRVELASVLQSNRPRSDHGDASCERGFANDPHVARRTANLTVALELARSEIALFPATREGGHVVA